jgi:Flp pilus assembly protein protease CpaA
MDKSKLQKFDTLTTGIVAGIVLPVVVYFLMYFAKIQDIHTTLFSNRLLIGNIIPIIISHCVLPNLVFFFIFNGLNWIQAAKGVLGTTVVLTLLIFAIKLFFTLI